MRLDDEIDLITQMLQGLYDAENQLLLVLPRVAARAASPALQAALRSHLEETRGHARRLEQMATALDVPCSGRTCLAMQGLLKEGEVAMGYGGSDALVDAAIIASCQGVEHFEISQYRALRALCERAGAREVVDALTSTLSEEEQASRALDTIASESLHGGGAHSSFTVGSVHSTKGQFP